MMITAEEYGHRVADLQDKIAEQDLDVYIVSEPESIYCFTGASCKAQKRPFFIIRKTRFLKKLKGIAVQRFLGI